MSVTAAVIFNVVLDLAIIAIIAHVMAFPRRLTPHLGLRREDLGLEAQWVGEAPQLERAA